MSNQPTFNVSDAAAMDVHFAAEGRKQRADNLAWDLQQVAEVLTESPQSVDVIARETNLGRKGYSYDRVAEMLELLVSHGRAVRCAPGFQYARP
jgi:hypothetical protein